MAERSLRVRGLLDLWAAHRELSTLEWSEFQHSILAAAAWIACAAIGTIAGWLAVNVAVVLAFREQPLRAVLAIVVVNSLGAAIAGWRANRLLRRPFFALTRREAARDVGALLKVIS